MRRRDSNARSATAVVPATTRRMTVSGYDNPFKLKDEYRMGQQAYVYILASHKYGTLYTGVTSNLVKRMLEHKNKARADSFTAKYNVNQLVWYLAGEDIVAAIETEKKIKNRSRAWKIALIEECNADWSDLSHALLDPEAGYPATACRMTESGRLR